jgi:hypothetical protein
MTRAGRLGILLGACSLVLMSLWVPVSAQAERGIALGRVVDIHDPEERGRVKVAYEVGGLARERWVRVARPVPTPEVGDGVVVGLVDGDPQLPVVLGILD